LRSSVVVRGSDTDLDPVTHCKAELIRESAHGDQTSFVVINRAGVARSIHILATLILDLQVVFDNLASTGRLI
jgi:hypothetical protein